MEVLDPALPEAWPFGVKSETMDQSGGGWGGGEARRETNRSSVTLKHREEET